jgi:hydroxymethylbilane synthase
VPQSSVASIIRLGTRGSPLALFQARLVQSQLIAAHGLDPARVAIEVIRTTGDQIQDRLLAEAGGKGLFTKEIEEALIAGRIDLAVHSAKDMPTVLPAGLVCAAYLRREDARDAFVCRQARTLVALPPGATVGTASLRRQAMVKRLRPDLRVVPLRGNVETRLRKLEDGVADATVLALAGLKRLGLESVASSIFEMDEFLPAVGQGAIAVETRQDDAATRALLAPINDPNTMNALLAERAFLAELDGSCRTPIAGHAMITAGSVHLRGQILKVDGSQVFEATREGSIHDAAALGADAGRELKHRGGPDFFARA